MTEVVGEMKEGSAMDERNEHQDGEARKTDQTSFRSVGDHDATAFSAGADALFAELETYGVRHEDRDMRNVTYRQSDGRFCVIDFELATILPGFEKT